MASFVFEPIGFARTPFVEKVDAPRQAELAHDVEGTIELLPGRGYEDALDDLGTWDRLWLVFVFDRANGFRPKVLPPRSDVRRGLFSTRSPHRPNPIGLSCVRLLGVSGLVVRVGGIDLLDRTPILDIKPYVPYADAFPDASSGWVGKVRDAGPTWNVVFSERAHAELSFLRARGIDLEDKITRVLALGPAPHAYRRIRRDKDGFRLAMKDWRVLFRAADRTIEIVRIETGYRPRQLARDPSLDVHRAFVAAFPVVVGASPT